MFRVYWLWNAPAGDFPASSCGLKLKFTLLLPALSCIARGLVKTTGLPLSVQIACMFSPASVVRDTPVLALTTDWLGVKVTLARIDDGQLSDTLVDCETALRLALLIVPNFKLTALGELKLQLTARTL